MGLDAGIYYALLRFEEASLALRAALQLQLVDSLRDRALTREQLRQELGFTPQAAKTFFGLLLTMDVLQLADGKFSASPRAQACLALDSPASRQPYLQMGSGDQVGQLIEMLKGNFADDSLPLYASGNQASLMEAQASEAVAREIGYGLASRARNFADPLSQVIAEAASSRSRRLADLGAGSPFVAHRCLSLIKGLEAAVLVDQAAGLKFAREMAAELSPEPDRLQFQEADIFVAVPEADVYCMSNTAHDWLPEDYLTLAKNIRAAIAPKGIVVVHEPLLRERWDSPSEWQEALWMACYALALYKLTAGQGTCYTAQEHDTVMHQAGFSRRGLPIKTLDGCSAICYQADMN